MTQFSDFGLSSPIQKALQAKGYGVPTPIQAQAIPPVMKGRDICGIAQTGTGKTAAFALPSLHRLSSSLAGPKPSSCRMLVLAPTRELASQIADSFRTYGRFLQLTVATAFGGVPINRQVRQLGPGVDVLVATPGRLLDLIDSRALTLRHVEILVLDEADQMLDLGFIHALKRIIPMVPAKRQTLFFSATMPKTIAELAERFLTDPVQVAVAPVSAMADRIEQQVIYVSQPEKPALLSILLREPAIDRAIIFSRTKHGADRLVRQLGASGIRSEAIHGNKSQPQRDRALASFRSGECKFLIATDIAARGIDVGGVSHVFNFDLPNVPEQYVHRVGRTARAGAAGIAIALCSSDERPYMRDIEKLTGHKMAVAPLPADFVAQAAKFANDVRTKSGPAPRVESQHRHGGARRKPAPAAPGRSARPEGQKAGHKRRRNFAGAKARAG